MRMANTKYVLIYFYIVGWRPFCEISYLESLENNGCFLMTPEQFLLTCFKAFGNKKEAKTLELYSLDGAMVYLVGEECCIYKGLSAVV